MDFETVDPLSVPANAVLFDIREQNEWDAGHAPQARHLPASELAARTGELFEKADGTPLDDDAEIYLVCRGGGRSMQAAQWLTMQGIDVINVGGGMGAWVEQGLPIVRDDGGEATII